VLRSVGQSGASPLAAFAFSARVPSPDSFALFGLTFTFRNCLAIDGKVSVFVFVFVLFFFFGVFKSQFCDLDKVAMIQRKI
jgi:hypothetical protein